MQCGGMALMMAAVHFVVMDGLSQHYYYFPMVARALPFLKGYIWQCVTSESRRPYHLPE